MNELGKMTLLYAEDEPATLKLHTEYFENYFKQVYTAENGKQALAIYKEKEPDVVVLDINMPLVNGLEVSREIRKKDKKTQIVLLTARIDKEAFMEAVELGLTAYLEKPITRRPMQAALAKISDAFTKQSVGKLWFFDDQFFTWDKNKQELCHGKTEIHLTKKEKQLLDLFVSSRHRNVTYQQIYEYVWFEDQDKEYSENTIKTLIKGLRDKLPPQAIKNVYAIGYHLNTKF